MRYKYKFVSPGGARRYSGMDAARGARGVRLGDSCARSARRADAAALSAATSR